MSEAKFSRKLQKILRGRGWWVVKYHASRYTPEGVPDLLCCYMGRFIGLELKRDAKAGLSEWQARAGASIQEKGGLFYRVDPTNYEDMLNAVERQLG